MTPRGAGKQYGAPLDEVDDPATLPPGKQWVKESPKGRARRESAVRRPGGRKSKTKGNREERKIVHLHLQHGIPCERVPLSGAVGGLFAGDIVTGPYVGEVKIRAKGQGWRVLDGWLGKLDLLFLRRDCHKPCVYMPWKTYVKLRKGTNEPVSEVEVDTLVEQDLQEIERRVLDERQHLQAQADLDRTWCPHCGHWVLGRWGFVPVSADPSTFGHCDHADYRIDRIVLRDSGSEEE